MIKTGTRLESQVCDTQVIVISTAESLEDLRCGGHAMVEVGAGGAGGELDEQFSDGTLMGKRYVDDAGAEVLVTRAGAGTLSIGADPLRIKQSTALPASD